MDDELDMLSELVTHPGWRVLKGEMVKYLDTLYTSVLTPALDDFDLIKKEGDTRAIKALKQFVNIVEHKVENYNRTVKR